MLFSLDSGATPVAVDVHFEDGCVVNETVDGCERHSGIREDPVPFTKRLVGGNHDRSSLISGADELEEDRCLCLVLGDIGQIIEDQQVIFVELGQGGFQCQLTSRDLEFLNEIGGAGDEYAPAARSEEHTSELQSLMRISYAIFCLQKKINETT